MRTAPKYQNEAVIHRLIASGRVGKTATLNKRSRDPTDVLGMYLSLSTKYFVMYLGTSTSTFLKLKYKIQASTRKKELKYR